MGTKDFVILAFWGIAALLFALVGFTIEDGSPDYNFIGVGLSFLTIGFILDRFWKTP